MRSQRANCEPGPSRSIWRSLSLRPQHQPGLYRSQTSVGKNAFFAIPLVPPKFAGQETPIRGHLHSISMLGHRCSSSIASPFRYPPCLSVIQLEYPYQDPLKFRIRAILKVSAHESNELVYEMPPVIPVLSTRLCISSETDIDNLNSRKRALKKSAPGSWRYNMVIPPKYFS